MGQLSMVSLSMDTPRTPTESLDQAHREWVEESYECHREWVRHIVTLCSTGLTLLVALQSTYVPRSPHGIWLLMACWISLTLATFCGVVALYSKAQATADAANEVNKVRREEGDMAAYRRFVSIPGHKVRWYFPTAAKVLFVSFFIALASLTLFACLNLPK